MAQNTQFRESEKACYWYVDLPPDRPTRQTCSRKRWLKIVNPLIEQDEHGNRIHREPSLFETDLVTMRVDGDDTGTWKDYLRGIIDLNGFRMFWEPKPPRKPRRPPVSLFE